MNDSEANTHHSVYISLGSNIHPEENLLKAHKLLCDCCSLQKTSQIWETKPIGSHGPNFLNAAALIRSSFSLLQIKYDILRPIEERLGRIRQRDKYAPRTIDLDIIIFDGEIVETSLWELAHLAVPMSELWPDLVQPQTGKTLLQIARHLKQKGEVIPRPDLRFVS